MNELDFNWPVRIWCSLIILKNILPVSIEWKNHRIKLPPNRLSHRFVRLEIFFFFFWFRWGFSCRCQAQKDKQNKLNKFWIVWHRKVAVTVSPKSRKLFVFVTELREIYEAQSVKLCYIFSSLILVFVFVFFSSNFRIRYTCDSSSHWRM